MARLRHLLSEREAVSDRVTPHTSRLKARPRLHCSIASPLHRKAHSRRFSAWHEYLLDAANDIRRDKHSRLQTFAAPQPHSLPVGTVGAAQQVKAVAQAVAENAPGKVQFTRYGSAVDAQDALEHRAIFGAYVMADDGTTAQLFYAGANGQGVTNTVEGIFGGVTPHSHTALKAQDVVAAASGDTRGLGIF